MMLPYPAIEAYLDELDAISHRRSIARTQDARFRRRLRGPRTTSTTARDGAMARFARIRDPLEPGRLR